ncbi:MAG: ribosome biogenesis GTPase Der [Patescibacteria group bacterium]
MKNAVQPPKVVIVGRTNVGKSTLFNTLVEEQKSLVSAVPGTTRDRYEADCIWRGQVIRLIDTGGLDIDASDEIERNIVLQAEMAMKEAELIIFVVDAKSGIQKEDRELASKLMKSDKPVIVVANKADNEKIRSNLYMKGWGTWPLAQPIAVSAKQSTGTGDLLDLIYENLTAQGKPPVDVQEISATRVSVIGRPNVGKSSLINAVVGQHRFITSPMAHTTREPNDTLITVDGQQYQFIDTAGIRKLARVHAGKSKLENSGVDRSLTSLKRSDVVLFVLDISKKITGQDKFLAGQIADAEASAVIVANKWDLIPDKETNTIKEYEEYIRMHLPMLSYAPIVFISALSGKRVQHLFELIDYVYKSRFTQLNDNETHEFISQAIVKHKPSRGKGVQHPKIIWFKQTGINPPSFKLGLKQTHREALAESYLRFLTNLLRDVYNFEGTPIRISVKARKKSHTTY